MGGLTNISPQLAFPDCHLQSNWDYRRELPHLDRLEISVALSSSLLILYSDNSILLLTPSREVLNFQLLFFTSKPSTYYFMFYTSLLRLFIFLLISRVSPFTWSICIVAAKRSLSTKSVASWHLHVLIIFSYVIGSFPGSLHNFRLYA
jgi:hypothetical protein